MNPLLISALLTASVLVSGCVTPQGSASGSSSVATPTQTQQFMTAVEAKRGSALTLAERVQLQGLTGSAKLGIDNAQRSFLNRIGAQVGLNGDIVAALIPDSAKPLSQTEVVQKLEARLGKSLTAADKAAVQTATTLRNNSVASLKVGLANSIGGRIGMDGQVILALMPLLGF